MASPSCENQLIKKKRNCCFFLFFDRVVVTSVIDSLPLYVAKSSFFMCTRGVRITNTDNVAVFSKRPDIFAGFVRLSIDLNDGYCIPQKTI
jgi:hypothetical protein